MLMSNSATSDVRSIGVAAPPAPGVVLPVTFMPLNVTLIARCADFPRWLTGAKLACRKTIVSTLWPINDLATSVYMQRFYANLLEKKMPKSEALREAQLWMIRGALSDKALDPTTDLSATSEKLPNYFALPSIWAPFVISGDWR